MADAPPKPKFNKYPWWCARFWHGMRLGDWLKLVARNKFRIHPLRWGLAFTVTLGTAFNTILSLMQSAIYERRINATKLAEDPIFIIGHWRSGTTYLHELVVLDERLSYPTTFECFAPNHCLLTAGLFEKIFFWAVPSQRPMDNVAVGWKAPQEDEFALCGLGVPGPYSRIAFPNSSQKFLEYLDMQGLPPEDLSRWKKALYRFTQMLTARSNKRLVLKSPTHTGRVEVLLDLFPKARFIHIVRHPDALFPSTVRLWQSLDLVQGLQIPKHDDLKEYVHNAYERMYGGFERQRALIPPGQIADLRYEDLVRDPLGELEKLYAKLELGDFTPAREKIAAYVAGKKDYQTNRHELDESTRNDVRTRWRDYMTRYGYE